MIGVQSRGRAVARLLAVCALLVGLFLMHGAPATAADGCHGAVPAPAPAHGGHTAHGDHAAAMAPMAPMATPSSPHAVHQAASGAPGTQCVATTVRDRIPLPDVPLLAVVALAGPSARALIGRRVTAGETGRRGPPGGGRDLLMRVCIART
ncbi:hypothetical protein AB0C96_24970 [Streptomyces sp. NPDC048506]|uniref:hypothetical protein n=1 Tax=Streptomyces sp. NPDC048506 TaxID=3155028 RepID=UPI00343AD191